MDLEFELKMYNEFWNAIYYKIEPLLIDSFIEFYSEEYKSKIEKLFEELLIVRCDYLGKLDSEEKNEYIKNLEDQEAEYINKVSDVIYQGENVNLLELSEKEILDLLSKDHSLSFDDFINAKRSIINSIYQKCVLSLSEKVPENQFVLVGTNVVEEESFEDMKPIIENFIHNKGLNVNEMGYALLGIDILSFIQIRGYGIPIHTIIHEANHLLSRSSIAFNPATQLNIIASGIDCNPSKDLIYEIINDHMADEIEAIFNRKLKECGLEFYSYIFPQKKETGSIYPIIDNVCNQIILNFYTSAKLLIKDSIIRGEGRRIYKIVGSDLYDQMNSKYHRVLDVMRCNPGQSVILSDQLSQRFCSYQSILEKRLIEYYQYEEEMKKYKKFFNKKIS